MHHHDIRDDATRRRYAELLELARREGLAAIEAAQAPPCPVPLGLGTV